MGCGLLTPSPTALHHGMIRNPMYKGPFWTGAENLAPTRIRSPDRPARSKSLHRLSYPVSNKVHTTQKWTRQQCMLTHTRTLQCTICNHHAFWDSLYINHICEVQCSSTVTGFTYSKNRSLSLSLSVWTFHSWLPDDTVVNEQCSWRHVTYHEESAWYSDNTVWQYCIIAKRRIALHL
jgi:hypothetical protein